MNTITKALNDLKDFYGLKELKNIELNMEDPIDPYITFVSNRPKIELFEIHDKHMWPETMKYRLSLSIVVDKKMIDAIKLGDE